MAEQGMSISKSMVTSRISSSNDVVRRSSRSNKGQHPKLEQEQIEAVAAPVVKRKTKTQSEKHSEEASDEEEGQVNCICGAKDVGEDDERSMCECEKCLNWQHVECMFGKDDAKLVPEGYTCNDCKKTTEAEAIDSFVKEPISETHEVPRNEDSSVAHPASSSNANANASLPMRIDDLHDKVRQSVASALKKILTTTAVPEALKVEEIQLIGQQTPDGFAERLAMKIEGALYEELGNKPIKKPRKKDPPVDVGPKYRDKFRTLSFNLRDEKNPLLRLRIVKGELTPQQIVTLSNEEMLNPELQKLAESVRQESIRDSVLKVNDAPRIRKTHKGDEIVENENIDQELNEMKQQAIRFNNQTNDTEQTKPGEEKHHGSDNEDGGSPPKKKRKHVEFAGQVEIREDDRDQRQQSVDYDQNNFAIDDVASYSPAGSPDSHVSSPESGLISDDDFELDDVLNGDDNEPEEEPSNKSINKTKAKEEIGIWVGNVSMTGYAQFPGSAVHLQGADNFNPFDSWSQIFDLSGPLVIDGRLDEAKAGNYLYAIRQTKALVSFVLKSDEPVANQAGFNKIYEYYHERNKVGVIKSRGKNVKDAYLITLGPQDPVPAYLALDEQSEEMVLELQSQKQNIIICLFVNSPFPSSSGRPPLPVSAPAPPAGVLPTQGAASLGLSTRELDILKDVLARNPEVASNPQLPNNPQMLLDLLQKTQGGGLM